ncbi:hypothetical protein [Ureibacillus sp. GCM10028918]|uniref:hypothetical protein n=1 Tax=Ureibacillus sp. GCM10028918 TaxID=3273429 RepID=UPI003621614C
MWFTRLNRKAEGARQAPTTTGRIDKRTLFVLAGDSEVVEELAPAARHRKAEGARQAPTTIGRIGKRTLFVLAGDS